MKRASTVRSALSAVVSLLWPETCPHCGDVGTGSSAKPFCRSCWALLEPYAGSRCEVCGRPFASEHGVRCGECVTTPPGFDRLAFFGLHDGVLRDAVHLLKYRGRRSLARPLASLVAPMVSRDAGLICPVPLHPRRLRAREYNQSLLLAAELAALSNVPLVPDLLVKTEPGVPQVGLSRRERTRNVRGTMRARRGAVPEGIRAVLVDDVCTTGATVSEAAGVLKKAGAGAVEVIVLSRDDWGTDAVVA